MAKPEKRISIDDEIRDGIQSGYRNFRKRTVAGRIAFVFIAAYNYYPGFDEKVNGVIVEGAKLGGKGAFIATEFAANHIPLPDKFPSRHGSPIEFPVTMATLHIQSDFSNYSNSYSAGSQGATGPATYASLPPLEARAHIHVGPKPERIQATLEGRLA